MKDRTPDGSMVDVGDGVIEFSRIFQDAGRAGLRHFFVEHDNPDGPARSIRASFEHLSGIDVRM